MSVEGETPFATDPSYFKRELAHPDAMRQFEANALEGSLVTPEEAKAHVREHWSPVVARYDLLSDEAQALADLDRLNHTKLPDAETRQKWASESRAVMLATYGPERVGQALNDAKAFIRSDPQLLRFADRGFGDSPKLVLMAARLGAEARKAGKLR